MRMRGSLLAGLVAAAALAIGGTAQAAVTIGSNLTAVSFDNMPGCGSPCTITNLSLPAASQAPGGLTSPVNGTVTSWRAAGNTGVDLRLRILRQGTGVSFTGVATSAPASFTGPGASGLFATSLPISIGDTIGLNNVNDNLVWGQTLTANGAYFNPPLGDGAALTGTAAPNREALVQATIEPTNTVAFGAVTRNKKKGTATLKVSVPNAGQLAYSGQGVSVTGSASVGAPGDIQLTIKATGKKRKKLNQKGKVSVAPTVTFTPNNGTARSSTTNLKLRKKL